MCSEGRLWRDLESTAETRMRGSAVIFNRLINSVFWLECKDEGKRRNDRIGEGDSICSYMKKVLMFLKNFPSFSKNFPSFFKNIKVFLCTYALVYTYGGTSLRVRMRKPTHIYASGYTYIRINLHLYRYYVRCRTGQIGTVRLWLRKI